MEVSKLKITAQIAATLKKTLGDGSQPALEYALGLFSTVPDDANLLFVNGYSIASGGSQSLDLSGSLEDCFGDAMVFSKVYGILVLNKVATTGKVLQLGADANHLPIINDKTKYETIGPSGCYMKVDPVDGITVTAGTGDILKIANPGGGTAIDVAVAILGKA